MAEWLTRATAAAESARKAQSCEPSIACPRQAALDAETRAAQAWRIVVETETSGNPHPRRIAATQAAMAASAAWTARASLTSNPTVADLWANEWEMAANNWSRI